MDTSETNVKMLKRAVEIQERWKEFVGDFYSIGVRDFIGVVEWKTIRKKNFIWLPRQDQLQEMVEHSPYDCFFDGVPNDNENEKQKIEHYYLQFKSWEQLWLAFVMQEKFGKVWDGEDWVAGEPPESHLK